MPNMGRRPGDRLINPSSPRGPGSTVLLGVAAGEVTWAAVGSAGATFGKFAQTGTDEVIPAAAAHVLALELVVETAVLEVELAGTIVDRHDGECRVGAHPVLHEGALGHGPADGRRAGCLVNVEEAAADPPPWGIEVRRRSCLTRSPGSTRR